VEDSFTCLLGSTFIKDVFINLKLTFNVLLLLQVLHHLKFLVIFFLTHFLSNSTLEPLILHRFQQLPHIFFHRVLQLRRLNELPRVRTLTSLNNLIITREIPSIQHILLYRIIKKKWLLLHKTHHTSILLDVVVFDINSIN